MKSLFKNGLLAVSLLSIISLVVSPDLFAGRGRRGCSPCAKRKRYRSVKPCEPCNICHRETPCGCKKITGEGLRLRKETVTTQCEEKVCKLVPICKKVNGKVQTNEGCWEEVDRWTEDLPVHRDERAASRQQFEAAEMNVTSDETDAMAEPMETDMTTMEPMEIE